jgi:hypothetical protein
MAVHPAPTELIVIDDEPTPVPPGAVAFKYDDAIESACWLYDEAEALQIEREDPSVIVWVSGRKA